MFGVVAGAVVKRNSHWKIFFGGSTRRTSAKSYIISGSFLSCKRLFAKCIQIGATN